MTVVRQSALDIQIEQLGVQFSIGTKLSTLVEISLQPTSTCYLENDDRKHENGSRALLLVVSARTSSATYCNELALAGNRLAPQLCIES